jgi:hypothetical protein
MRADAKHASRCGLPAEPSLTIMVLRLYKGCATGETGMGLPPPLSATLAYAATAIPAPMATASRAASSLRCLARRFASAISGSREMRGRETYTHIALL